MGLLAAAPGGGCEDSLGPSGAPPVFSRSSEGPGGQLKEMLYHSGLGARVMLAEPLVSQLLTSSSGVPGAARLTSGPHRDPNRTLVSHLRVVTPVGTSSRAGPDVSLYTGCRCSSDLGPQPFPRVA